MDCASKARTAISTIPRRRRSRQTALSEHFDLVLLSCKAYDLEDAIRSFAPAVGPDTSVLPMLNGMRHIELLTERFGSTAVLGGLCVIASTLGDDGRILHLNDLHSMAFGERDGTTSPRTKAIEQEFSTARFDAALTGTITQEMWEKWVFIATMAGATCLMRSTLGDIEAAGGAPLVLALLSECAAIAEEWGFAPRSCGARAEPHELHHARVAAHRVDVSRHRARRAYRRRAHPGRSAAAETRTRPCRFDSSSRLHQRRRLRSTAFSPRGGRLLEPASGVKHLRFLNDV